MVWLRTLLFALTFVATTLVLIPRWIVAEAGDTRLAAGPGLYGGVVLVGLGSALMVWCWWEFATRGRGTPAPFDPPRRRVVAGPYRHVRNPMYIAALLFLAGESALFGSRALLWYTGGFWLASHLFVLGYEERTLSRRFGTDYAAYRAAVGRWLPRIAPYTSGTRAS